VFPVRALGAVAATGRTAVAALTREASPVLSARALRAVAVTGRSAVDALLTDFIGVFMLPMWALRAVAMTG
jgi:hypothetical protein